MAETDRLTQATMVVLGRAQIAQLDAVAKRRMLSRSAIIREACDDLLRRVTDAEPMNITAQRGQHT